MWDEYEVSLPIDSVTALILPPPICSLCPALVPKTLAKISGGCVTKQRKETKEPTRLLLEGAVEVTIDIKKLNK